MRVARRRRVDVDIGVGKYDDRRLWSEIRGGAKRFVRALVNVERYGGTERMGSPLRPMGEGE